MLTEKVKNVLIAILVITSISMIYLYLNKTSVSDKVSHEVKNEKVKMFYSPGCGYCKKQMEIISKNSLDNKVLKVNCDENANECEKNRIEGVPCFVKPDGDRETGLLTANKLKEFIGH